MDGSFKDGIDFRVEATLKVEDGCIFTIGDNRLRVEGAKEILVFVNIGTSAKGESPLAECKKYSIPSVGWDELLRQHIEEHQRHYGGLNLQLPLKCPNIPTDERIENFKNGSEDAGLPLLYFNYGRYLLCASSANGELPANLQGK